MLDEKTIKDHGLTLEEYAFIVKLIGKDPNLTELGIFSVMWSEHCGYKSSRVYLKGLPAKGKHVIQGPGENAGILDIGDGLAVVFKIESHNHPSYIEPYQGAATGVGGILRDIFTMGARPIAVMDSLHFGPLDAPQNKTIMEGVVSGIAGYGNSIGIPTVGGEIYFHEGYSQNPLVNVFALGLAEKEKLFYAKAEGHGKSGPLRRGQDGPGRHPRRHHGLGRIRERHRTQEAQRPGRRSVQGEAPGRSLPGSHVHGHDRRNPGHGRRGPDLLDDRNGGQGRHGDGVDLDLVPQREEGMTAYQILLSESQERMLICAKKDRVKEVQAIFAKWDLDAVIIGHVTEGGRLKAVFKGEVVVDIPVDAVVNLCPVYRRPVKKPAYLGPVSRLPEIPVPADLEDVFFKLISSPTIADKEWVFRQYDHMIQINTALLPGADAAVLRIKGSKRALAMTLDGNPHYAYLDPRPGRPHRRGRSLPQPGLRRGAADRRDELPELRQSGKAGDHVAVQGGRPGDVRSLPGVRDPGHGRERQSLQRYRRNLHPADARHGDRRDHRGHR